METTLAAFAKLKRHGKLFLNLSPESLLDEAFSLPAMLARLARHGPDPKRVVIEITESMPTYDFAPLAGAVRAFRDAGLEVALDDLGEGFSSLRLWSELRPDYIKVDKHFVQNIHRNPVKLQFLRSIQAMAENSGARVVAEGIETRSEFMVIRELGLSYGQGYFIARPEARPRSTPGVEVLACLGNPDGERFHPLPALSIGAVASNPYAYGSQHEVAAASDAKRQAKKTQGSSLFIEQRRHPAGTATLFDDLPEPRRASG
jgi:EAL domain-containing protein (putative c-di-GMP-specific phosphodiesterase class I)